MHEPSGYTLCLTCRKPEDQPAWSTRLAAAFPALKGDPAVPEHSPLHALMGIPVQPRDVLRRNLFDRVLNICTFDHARNTLVDHKYRTQLQGAQKDEPCILLPLQPAPGLIIGTIMIQRRCIMISRYSHESHEKLDIRRTWLNTEMDPDDPETPCLKHGNLFELLHSAVPYLELGLRIPLLWEWTSLSVYPGQVCKSTTYSPEESSSMAEALSTFNSGRPRRIILHKFKS